MMIETLPSARRRATRSRIIAPSLAPIAASGSSSRMMSASACTVRGAAIAWHRAGAGDRLALAAGQPRHRHVQARDVDADLVEPFPRLPAHPRAREERERRMDPLAAQEHVLHDVEVVDEREVLVDAVDAERARVVDRAQLDLLALDDQPPFVG